MIKSRRKYLIAIVIVLSIVAGFLVYAWWPRGPRAGSVLDEARLAHRPASDFKAADEDYFHLMDQNKAGSSL